MVYKKVKKIIGRHKKQQEIILRDIYIIFSTEGKIERWTDASKYILTTEEVNENEYQNNTLFTQ